MQTLMEALTSSACAIVVPSKALWRAAADLQTQHAADAVNHYAPLKREECKRDE
jgi:hypothetical protein